jgi:hypothetical protein
MVQLAHHLKRLTGVFCNDAGWAVTVQQRRERAEREREREREGERERDRERGEGGRESTHPFQSTNGWLDRVKSCWRK